MTKQQAERCLEDGCPHSPWDDSVCGQCAKDVLEAVRGTKGERLAKQELTRWFQFEDENNDD